jgi:dTDP-4-dehydrorhamnose reductase
MGYSPVPLQSTTARASKLFNMRILVTGKDGQVGHEFSSCPYAGWEIFPVGRADCDLGHGPLLRGLIRRIAPDVIVNAAAYTAVDQAEKERALCFAVNAEAPGVLAEEASRLNALLVHYSTDYVFDGEKGGPYVEADKKCPLNVWRLKGGR